jgi:hypothetical protein
MHPQRTFSPNQKYAALIETAGYVPVPLSGEDHVELLPATWRAVNAYGVKISHRIYDGDELSPLRGQRSGVKAKRDLWEVHQDPYDVSRIWVRNHWDGGWITVFWKHLSSSPVPFGELAWDHARQQLAAEGKTPTEQEIAQAAESLLQRAHQGPETKPGRRSRKPTARDRRVAARTKATAKPAWPRPEAHVPAAASEDTVESAEPASAPPEEKLADVVPLAVFDAKEEASKWW